MNEAAFFTAIRPAFGNRLSGPQVRGMEEILEAVQRYGVFEAHHVAHILAHVRRETGGYMSPIKETVMPWHKDKEPSDATVIKRLDKAWADGNLPHVKKPYWRDGWFGRGPIQITHRVGYEKLGKAIEVDLVKNPALALDPAIGARIAVVGMRDGLFTKKKLADYNFPDTLDAPPKSNPRRIVNGVDGSDAEVARYHRQFHAALIKAGWQGAATSLQKTQRTSDPTSLQKAQTAPPTSVQKPHKRPSLLELIIRALKAWFKKSA